jgi:predicted transglutaminase-like cysteine proteinase
MTPQRIHLTARVLKAIRDVNVRVNNAILPEEDIDQYGRSEFWAYPDSGRGDCEDYQLLKQRILRNAGFPQSALRHAVVNDLNGAGHDVLVIHTDRGDFVIDNLSNEVRTPAETGYTFRQILSPNSDYQWRTFAGRDWRAAYTAASADNEPVYRMSAAALSALEQSLHAQMLAANTFVRAQATPN